jgi:hypothetical protein
MLKKVKQRIIWLQNSVSKAILNLLLNHLILGIINFTIALLSAIVKCIKEVKIVKSCLRLFSTQNVPFRQSRTSHQYLKE